MARTKGYHYVTRRDGTKYRVYSGGLTRGSKRGRGKSTFKKAVRRNKKRMNRIERGGDTIMGYGSYRKGRGGSKVLAGNPPTVQNSKGGFIVRHREYLGDINTSQSFANYAFSLNPGIESTFPWLASIAQNFEEWVPRGIVFEFKTTSSDAVVSTNANAALGTVIMATEYNPYNGVFANKQQMENYEWAKSCKPSMSMLHGVECSKKLNPQNSFFIRTAPVPTSQDQRWYDLGIFQLATVGMQSNGAACGELWCSYEIELRKPRIQVGIAGQDTGNTNFDHYQIYDATHNTITGITPNTPFGTGTTAATGITYPTTASTLGGMLCGGIMSSVAQFSAQPNNATKNNFLGGVPVLAGGNPTGALGVNAANTYYFPPGVARGNFMVSYNTLYTTGGAFWNPVLTATNCVGINLLNNDTLSAMANTSATTSTSCMVTLFVTVLAPNASFTLSGSTGAYATLLWSDFFVVQIPPVLN
ncbi:capsid protein [Crucivirus-534]|nr:capsid protein [Crucivirus-534]